jgi:anaerobic selenocysteine-containing dehydrogenase
MNRLGEDLLHADPPVRCLFVYNANPLATLPAQEKVRAGLLRADLFTVVFDPFLTDTARYADVVLPAATFPERWEIHGSYGAYRLHSMGPVAARVGESRTNHEVFGELVHRLGLSRPGDPETESEVAAAIFGGDAAPGLAETRLPDFGDRPVQMVDVFPRTADGKIHLVPEDLDREAPGGLHAYRNDPAPPETPLALISPATDRTINSTLGQLVHEEAVLSIHPVDARARKLRTDDAVRVWNAHGEVRCRAYVTPEVRMGVVELPKGLWSRHTRNGATANALAPDTLTDLGQGACFNDARVQVERESG